MRWIALLGIFLVALFLAGCQELVLSVHNYDAKITAVIKPVGAPNSIRVETIAVDQETKESHFLAILVPNSWKLQKGENLRITCKIDFVGGIHLNTCLAKRQDTSN